MVERNEVQQMAKFMSALNDTDFSSGSIGNNDELYESNAVRSAPVMIGDTGIAEMKAILERFHNATDNVLAEVPMDRSLREGLIMERTPYGARMGNWKIVEHKSGKRKLYDVIHESTNETIAADLMLYEAACGLTRQLNEGGHINSKVVVDLLHAEQSYAGAIHDMVLYKHHLTKSPNSPRAPIYEARYGAAKRQAVSARDQVRKLSESV